MKTLLNNIDHHDLQVVLGHGPAFGDAINQVRVFPTEFEELARDYVILFRQGADGALEPVVQLGLDRDENLFLDGDRWAASSIPALRQREPFSIRVDAPDGEPMIEVDLDSPRIAAAGQGEPVFLPHGGNAPYLDHVAAILRRIHVGHHAVAPMMAALAKEGLIEPVTLELMVEEGLRYDLNDVFTIGAERLAALDGAALARLHREGFLRPTFAAAASLGNMARLIDRKTAARRRR